MPLFVADHLLRRSIGVFDMQTEEQGRRTKRYLQLCIALALFLVEAIAQQHPNAVVTDGFPVCSHEVSTHVILIVKNALVVVAPQRGKHGVAYFLTIDG